MSYEYARMEKFTKYINHSNHRDNDMDTMGVIYDNVNHNCELNIDGSMSCQMRIMCESILSENDCKSLYASDTDRIVIGYQSNTDQRNFQATY